VQDENYEIWLENVERVNYSRGVLPTEAEIIIVGGGMAGITSAYLLSKTGKKIILLEKRKLGENTTDCTTGFLTPVIDTDPIKLIKQFGARNAELILESHKKAVDEVEKIIKTEKIDCEFERCTNYIYANDKNEEQYLIKLAEGYKKLGIEAKYKKENKLKFNNFGYIEMPNHAKFHAIKYLTSLAKIAVKNGVTIAEDTKVTNITDKKEYVEVEIENFGIIKAKKVVSATYTPFGGPKKLTNLANLYKEYVVEFKLPKEALLNGTYEDTREPYNYFRIDNRETSDRLIIGGADNLNVLNIDVNIGFDMMRKYSQNLFNNTKLEEVRHWSGLMLETNDGLAFIGNSKGGNIFNIFGFSGNGMTYSYIAGKILLDQLTGQNNPYAKIYQVDRKISWWKNLFL
jgi:glycine/D-amino acid oxidase-like deaminating enzyme